MLATEGISGMAKDFFRRDPAVEDAYKRLMSGVDPTLGRSFQSLMPEEREKASELVGMFAKMHQGDTPMLQTEIRTLISVLNATEPRDYSSELDNQIKMVRNQILNEQELEIKPVTPKQSRSQMDMS